MKVSDILRVKGQHGGTLFTIEYALRFYLAPEDEEFKRKNIFLKKETMKKIIIPVDGGTSAAFVPGR